MRRESKSQSSKGKRKSNDNGSIEISMLKRCFIFIAECIQQSPPTNKYLVYLAYLISSLNLCSYTHKIFDQQDAQNYLQTPQPTRYYLKQPAQIHEIYYQLFQITVPFRFLNQFGYNTFEWNLVLLLSIFAFNMFIIIVFLHGFYQRQKNSEKQISSICRLVSQLCTYYNGIFLLPQAEFLTSLLLNGCISLRLEVCPLMSLSSASTQLLVIRVFAGILMLLTVVMSITHGQLCDQTTNIQEKGMQKIFIHKINHSLQIFLKMILSFLYFISTKDMSKILENSVSTENNYKNTNQLDLSMNTSSGNFFLLLQGLIIAVQLIEWDEFYRFITLTDLKQVKLYIVLQFFTFLFILSDILHNMQTISEKCQILIILIITPLLSIFYIQYCIKRYEKILHQLLSDITFSKELLEDSQQKGEWVHLNRKIAVYLSMEQEIIQNNVLSFSMISSLCHHNTQCKDVSCSCNKTNTSHIHQSNQVSLNVDHFHEYLEYLIQLHTKQSNFYQEQNIYAFIQYLSYLISRHKFTEVAGKTTYLIREKVRGALQLNFFLDVQVEALLKISKNSMIGEFQSKIAQQKQYEAFIQAGKFLKVESTLQEIMIELQDIVSEKIELYNTMQAGFNTYNHLINLSTGYLSVINKMERKLQKFHQFASYSMSKNLLIFFYLHIHGDFRKAISSQKLRCPNNAERPVMNDVLMAFSSQVVTITASIGKNYGSILKYSDGTPEFFGYSKKDFYLVKRIEQLMPNCIASKHQLLVDHFVQTGDSDVVREKRLIFIKKNRELLFPANLFLCFNFSYLDDFVFTAFFCSPEAKDYDPKKETFLLFDYRMKLSGYSENFLGKIGVKKVNQKDLQRIELQDVFPYLDIEEVLESETIEYSNAHFQFPLFNHLQNTLTKGGKNSQFEIQSQRSMASVKSLKTLKSMNSTQFKQQEWSLFVCDLKIDSFSKQFRSGEVLQYYSCTIKEMREESDKSGDDESSSNESIDDISNANMLKNKKQGDIQNQTSLQDKIIGINQEINNEKSVKGKLECQNTNEDDEKQDSINQIPFDNQNVVKKRFSIQQQLHTQQSNLTAQFPKNQLNESIKLNKPEIKESKQEQNIFNYKMSPSMRNEQQQQLKQMRSQQEKNTQNLINQQNAEENTKEKGNQMNLKPQNNNYETQVSKTTKKQQILKNKNEGDQKQIIVQKKRSSSIQIDNKYFQVQNSISVKKPEERIKQNYAKKKVKKNIEDKEIPNLLQKQISDQYNSYLKNSKQEDDQNNISNIKFNNSQINCSNQLFFTNDQIVTTPERGIEISNRSAITTIESEAHVNAKELYTTNEKRKIDTGQTNDAIQPLDEFRAHLCSDMSEIKEDENEEQMRESAKKIRQNNAENEQDQAKQLNNPSKFEEKRSLRQSLALQKVAGQLKQQLSTQYTIDNKAKNNINKNDNEALNNEQKLNLIKQIMKMMNAGDSRQSFTQEELLEMDPEQLFQKYNQIYYRNYVKSKKGKNDLSYVQSDSTRSHVIQFQQGEALSYKMDDRYDIKKYQENMNLIDKFIQTNAASRKLNLVMLLKLTELIIIIIGMIVSKLQQDNSYANFEEQINLIKSQSTFRNSLNFFTTLTYLVDYPNKEFSNCQLQFTFQEYLVDMQDYLSNGSIVNTYEGASIEYINPYEVDNTSNIQINLRDSFILNAYYSQNIQERQKYFKLVYKDQCERLIDIVNSKLNEFSDDLQSIQVSSILIFTCIVISLFFLFSIGIFLFYKYQKEQRLLQKLMCSVPLRQIEIERSHLHKLRKKIEDQNQNILKSFRLLPFEEEIKLRMSEFKNENFIQGKLSRSTVGGTSSEKKIQKVNNYIIIKKKTHLEVTMFIMTLVVCLLCYLLPNIYIFFMNLSLIQSLPNSVAYFRYISEMQDSVTRLNTLNVYFQNDYSSNFNLYYLLYEQALNNISEYETTLFKLKTLSNTLFTDSQTSTIRDLVSNYSICDSVFNSNQYFDAFSGQLKQRCSALFEGVLLQGTKLTLSFMQNRYKMFEYQPSNFLPLDQTNEMSFYMFLHTKSCLEMIDSFYADSFTQNQTYNLIYIIVVILLIIIIYFLIIFFYFKRLFQQQEITRQLIHMVPFITIQQEDTIIKKIKQYTIQMNFRF